MPLASVACQQERAMNLQTGQVEDIGSSLPSPTSSNHLELRTHVPRAPTSHHRGRPELPQVLG